MDVANLWTYADMIEHVFDFLGESARDAKGQRDCRRSILSASRVLCNEASWSYFYSHGRIITHAAQSTGTISYTNSTRTVELTGSTFPAWAARGEILTNKVTYDVDSYVDATHIKLSVNSNPGADIAAGTAYTLNDDAYVLPTDFVEIHTLHTPTNWGGLHYVHPRDWLASRTLIAAVGTPRWFTIMGSGDFIGALELRFYPPPDQSYNIDFIYKRRPRPLLVDSYNAGTVSASNGGVILTGVGTNWGQQHVGSVLRLSADNVNFPTGLVGSNPYSVQRTILSVESATSLTVDAAFTGDLAGVLHVISDPIDVEEGVMFTAFQRCAELEIAIVRRMKTLQDCRMEYAKALMEAKAADSRNQAMRGVGWDSGARHQWWKLSATGADR